MFTLYQDMEKELFLSDYKPLPDLDSLNYTQVQELTENLDGAIENAFINHSEMLFNALLVDIETVQQYRAAAIIRGFSSGYIARIIGSAKYGDIYSAIEAALQRLDSLDSMDLFDIGTDPANIENLIRETYKERKY